MFNHLLNCVQVYVVLPKQLWSIKALTPQDFLRGLVETGTQTLAADPLSPVSRRMGLPKISLVFPTKSTDAQSDWDLGNLKVGSTPFKVSVMFLKLFLSKLYCIALSIIPLIAAVREYQRCLDRLVFSSKYKPCSHLSSRQKTAMCSPWCQQKVLSTGETQCVFWQVSIIGIITVFCSLFYNCFSCVCVCARKSLRASSSSFTMCASIDNLW